MHELDPAQPSPAHRPFVPRLVGGDADGETRESSRAPGQQAELHDPTVREIADSLTDLFLGARPGEARKSAAAAGPAAPGARGPAGTPRPMTVSGGATSNPRPTRFFGQGGVKAGHSSNGSGATVHPPAPVELLILGHLPVLASAWLSQYAGQAATSLGKPVALARLEPGGLSIDLFGVPRDVPVARNGSLGESIAGAASLAAVWLIRVDDLAEATLAESPRLAGVTVLSGVGESSIVAAYRALKAIAQRARGRTGEGADSQGAEAELRIALLGASPERAMEASARVRKAAATFLGRPVGVVVCPEKIGMTGMRGVYRGPFEGDAQALLAMIDRAPRAPAPPSSVERDRSDAASPVEPSRATAAAHGDADTDWLLNPEAVPPPDETSTGASMRAPTTAIPPTSQGAAPPAEQAAPSAAPVAAESAAALPPQAPNPASLLRLTGLGIRCPEAPGIELAADSAGALHAIAMDDPGGHTPHSGAPALAALLAADAWARANRDLLARALPFLAAGEVTLHLITRIPASARGLLGTRVRVHLLAQAAAPGELCVGLN